MADTKTTLNGHPIKLVDNGDGTFSIVAHAGGLVEKASARSTQSAAAEKEYTRAAGARQIEVYCESGSVRVRTDGKTCTSTTGEPLSEGFAAGWTANKISVYFVEQSTITVVSR